MTLNWKKVPAAWIAGDGDLYSDRASYVIFQTGKPSGYELWVWSGPAERPLGAMWADLRSMKRARRLAWYRLLGDAKKAATAFDSTGEFPTRQSS